MTTTYVLQDVTLDPGATAALHGHEVRFHPGVTIFGRWLYRSTLERLSTAALRLLLHDRETFVREARLQAYGVLVARRRRRRGRRGGASGRGWTR